MFHNKILTGSYSQETALGSLHSLLTLLGDPAWHSPFFHLPQLSSCSLFFLHYLPQTTLIRPFYHHANTTLFKSLRLKAAPQVKVRRHGSELQLTPAVLPKRSILILTLLWLVFREGMGNTLHGNLLTFGSIIHLRLLDQSLLEMVIPYEIKHSEALWWAHSVWVNLWYKRKPRGC